MPDRIDDNEVLYRSVRNNFDFFKVIDGAVKFSSTAFNDKGYRPSVDRAALRDAPEDTKLYPTDGITKIFAEEARQVKVPISADDPAMCFKVDVIYRPVPADNLEGLKENPAHSQIESDPEITVTRRFDKIKEALSRAATRYGWVIEPS